MGTRVYTIICTRYRQTDGSLVYFGFSSLWVRVLHQTTIMIIKLYGDHQNVVMILRSRYVSRKPSASSSMSSNDDDLNKETACRETGLRNCLHDQLPRRPCLFERSQPDHHDDQGNNNIKWNRETINSSSPFSLLVFIPNICTYELWRVWRLCCPPSPPVPWSALWSWQNVRWWCATPCSGPWRCRWRSTPTTLIDARHCSASDWSLPPVRCRWRVCGHSGHYPRVPVAGHCAMDPRGHRWHPLIGYYYSAAVSALYTQDSRHAAQTAFWLEVICTVIHGVTGQRVPYNYSNTQIHSLYN